MTTIKFTISDADAAALADLLSLQLMPGMSASEYAKLLLITDLHPERSTRENIAALHND